MRFMPRCGHRPSTTEGKPNRDREGLTFPVLPGKGLRARYGPSVADPVVSVPFARCPCKLPTVNAWAVGTFSALGNPQFRMLWMGTFLAFIAFFMSLVVNNVVAFELSGSNSAVGFVGFGQGVAQLALGPLGGALADRLPKKTVILACQLAITIAFAVLGFLVLTDIIEVIYLALGSFVIGVAFSFLGPARQAWMVELVEPHQRGNAVALSQVALNASRIIAPLAATFLLGADMLGAEGAFFLMAALYVAAMWYTVRLPHADTVPRTNHSVFGDIASGLGYVKRTPRLRLLVVSYVLTIMFGFAYTALLPGLLVNELDRKAKAITILLLANAVGGHLAHPGALIVVDFGTATTFDVIADNGDYCGGAIAPGVQLSLEVLHSATAKLPRIDVERPAKAIGTDTLTAMQSGIFWGYIGLIEGLIARMRAEWPGPMTIVATGGLAPLFFGATDALEYLDPDLTMRGLVEIHRRNKGGRRA